jgi:hypothetical protein
LLADFDANGSLVPQVHSRGGITLQLSRFRWGDAGRTDAGQSYRLVADDVGGNQRHPLQSPEHQPPRYCSTC